MANEAASVAAEEAPPTAPEPSLPDPPQFPKTDPAQKAMKEPAKPQTPVASMDAAKGEYSQDREGVWSVVNFCAPHSVVYYLGNGIKM